MELQLHHIAGAYGCLVQIVIEIEVELEDDHIEERPELIWQSSNI
jgi:hypothetical protein